MPSPLEPSIVFGRAADAADCSRFRFEILRAARDARGGAQPQLRRFPLLHRRIGPARLTTLTRNRCSSDHAHIVNRIAFTAITDTGVVVRQRYRVHTSMIP